jgi:hypothetical protein
MVSWMGWTVSMERWPSDLTGGEFQAPSRRGTDAKTNDRQYPSHPPVAYYHQARAKHVV